MAFVFKVRRKGGVSAKWYVRYRDPITQRVVTRAGYEDKAATQQLAARLVKEAARHAEGIGPAPAVIRIDDLDKLRQTFIQSRIDTGATAKHARLTDQRLRDMFSACSWRTSKDLNSGQAIRWLAICRQERKRFGLATTNNYLRAAKMFGRWLARKTHYDPFTDMDLLNADADRRFKRRSLKPAELARLLAATRESATTFRGLKGFARAAIYQTAAMSGLRLSELARLTPDLIDFESLTMYVSEEQKRRDEDTLPVHPKLAAILKPLCDGMAPDAPLWPGGWHVHPTRMLYRDLAAAGIAAKTPAGRIDLHAVRVTFVTNLGRAGVPLVAAQKLARHSDPRLTANIYTKLGDDDLAKELRKLSG